MFINLHIISYKLTNKPSSLSFKHLRNKKVVSPFDQMAPLLLLQGEKLQQLARLIRNQETEAIKNLSFKSEEERAKYLRDVRDNYNSAIKLALESAQLDQVKPNEPITFHHRSKYRKICINC